VVERRAAGWQPLWIDVRKAHEWEIVKLTAADRFIPHEDLIENGLPGVDLGQPILLQCKSGARSAKAAAALAARGFTHVYNLEGGILGWIGAVEPGLPTY
jgi:rhodanese-related sulfurtransferase